MAMSANSVVITLVESEHFEKIVATLLWDVRGRDAKEIRSRIREEV